MLTELSTVEMQSITGSETIWGGTGPTFPEAATEIPF